MINERNLGTRLLINHTHSDQSVAAWKWDSNTGVVHPTQTLAMISRSHFWAAFTKRGTHEDVSQLWSSW